MSKKENVKIPRFNNYRCQYGCLNVTVDVDNGVTPYMIKCTSISKPGRKLVPELTGKDGECVGMATSSMYPTEGIPANLKATYEWYKPSQEEMLKLHEQQKEHVSKGGLLLRLRTERDPIYHEDLK